MKIIHFRNKLHIAAFFVIFVCHSVNAEMISVSTEPRHYAQVDESFYNSDIFWVGDNLMDRYAMSDPCAAEQWAASLEEMGIDAVIYSGQHFRHNYKPDWDNIARWAATVTKALHRHGIKVIEHHEFTIFNYAGYKTMLDNLEWMQKDIRTGESWNWIAPNDEKFLREYISYLQEFQRVTGVDGYMLDELQFPSPYVDFGDESREDYLERVGNPMPNWVEGGNNFDSAESRNVLRWRSQIVPRANSRIMAGIHEVNPKAMNLSYCSDYSDSRGAAKGQNLTEDVAMYCSFMGWEVMIADALNSWRPWLRSLKMRLGYGNYYGIPVWSLNRQQMTKEAVYFAWGLSQLGKHSIWYSHRGIKTDEEIEYFKKYSTWAFPMNHQYARCLTNVGFLLSHQSRFANPDRSFFWLEAMGWADMMIEDNTQFDVLLDGDLENDGRLGKYKVLVLAGQAALTAKQCENLADWVKNGGTAILTRHTSLYDQFGEKLEQFRLWKEAGIKLEKVERQSYKVKGGFGGHEYDFWSAGEFYAVSFSAKSRVLLGARVANNDYKPVVVETPYGKGKFLYAAVDLGSENVEVELRNRSMFVTRENDDKHRLITNLIEHGRNGSSHIRLEMPGGVKGVAYQMHGGEENGDIYVQLLNVGGKYIKVGERVGYDNPDFSRVPLPEVTEPMVIYVFEDIIDGPAVVRSPMMERSVAIKGEKTDNSVTTFSIPGKYLKAYLQVHIPARELESQKPAPVPLAAEVVKSEGNN